MYILVAILIFGILIAIHELGHFIAAKKLGVRVNQFAIGMGPVLLKKQKGETEYSLRLLPIGGFCAMEGEDGSSNDSYSFTEKPIWRRFIILAAGSAMNFLLGFIIILLLLLPVKEYQSTTISSFLPGFPYSGEQGLMPGDQILRINGENIYTYSDLTLFLSRGEAKPGEDLNPYDFVVRRGGEKIKIDNLPLSRREYQVRNNSTGEMETHFIFGITCEVKTSNLLINIRNTWYNSIDFVRLVRLGLTDLITGGATAKDLSGPIGIVKTIGDVGTSSPSIPAALMNIVYLAAFISINLAVMNMLPLPALDGGRILFLIIEFIRRKPVNPKYENYVHLAGFALLMLLMVAVAYNDVVKIVTGS